MNENHRGIKTPECDRTITLVDVDLFSERSLEAKKRERAADNWRIRGGVPASEVDPGFNVDV